MPHFQYKPQQFQQDAVAAVTDMFSGVGISQFQRLPAFQLSGGQTPRPAPALRPLDFVRKHFHTALKDNLRSTQKRNNILATDLRIDGDYLVLDTQMETGTGKTFTFINAIFELHKQYQLTHFVIIVPSIAIKEGIKKTFDTTRQYFDHLYQQRIEVYEMKPPQKRKGRKSPPTGIMDFIHSQHPTVLIMTNHAFNSKKNVINQEIEGFNANDAKTPMDAIATKHPVLIIDEPQRVEGTRTMERIKDFNPLVVLRYSATFRKEQIKNLVYVLDSYDAFNKKLVKNITVTDYTIGETDSAFLGVRRLTGNEVELEAAGKNGKPTYIRTGIENPKTNKLFTHTKNPAYRNLRVTGISRVSQTVEFSDNRTLKLGEYDGRETENDNIVAEVMLRDTISKHLEKEHDLFARGIKCLSLIFIDRVKDYRNYESADDSGYLQNIFAQCYNECKKEFTKKTGVSPAYCEYLQQWKAADVHGGYFSIDRKRNKKIDEGEASKDNDTTRKLQQEISELILRDKEKILQPDNKLRFIFAHSALREGWDNPNVFQICKLRTAYAKIDIVQEVGRGLRICVNEELTRQDEDCIGGDFAAINRLDIFTRGNGEFIGQLQKALSDRRSEAKTDITHITPEKLREIFSISLANANAVWGELHTAGCIDDDGYLLTLNEIEKVLTDTELDPQKLMVHLKLLQHPSIENSRTEERKPREYRVSSTHYKKFQRLWELLHQKVIYEVRYSDNFIQKAADQISDIDSIMPLYVTRGTAKLHTTDGGFFQLSAQDSPAANTLVSDMPTREFLNQLAEKTNLPRNSIVRILSKVSADKYRIIQRNPFLAVREVANAINGVIYKNIVDNIQYHKVDGLRETETTITLTDKRFSAKHYIELNTLPSYKENNLWAEIAPYDSKDPEETISKSALAESKITIFAKIPRAVNIPAPMYPKGINPDFAIVVEKTAKKQLYFVAEAKPTTDTGALRREEQQRIDFMRKYFACIGADNIQFEIIKNYAQLFQLINGI